MRKRQLTGRLNRLVTIERRTDTDDDSGGQSESWASAGTAWVEATPVGGKEAVIAGSLRAAQPWRIEMRFTSDISTEDRLSGDWLPANHRIAIESVADPDGRRQRLVLFGTASPAFDLVE